ncbi:hypothetical protein [Rhizobium sp. CNPSo 3490]|uniref:preprotein translocase subunit SecA n=1 Tax=Rhizobium sp. CNPSo 3490 TaxID=3021407 RepID=UPI0033059462
MVWVDWFVARTPSPHRGLRGRSCVDVGSTSRASRARRAGSLGALHLFKRDVHYIVVDGKMQIVDEIFVK